MEALRVLDVQTIRELHPFRSYLIEVIIRVIMFRIICRL